MNDTYIIGAVREYERAVKLEVIAPSGEVHKLRLTAAMWERYAFSSGDVIEKARFDELRHDSERCEAVTKAMRLLADAPLSAKKLTDKLCAAGISKEIAEGTSAIMLKRGFIDEAAQAEAFALKTADAKNRGRSRIVSDLIARGYPKNVADAAASGVPSEVYDSALRRAIAKKCRGGIPSDRSHRDKLIASLVRSGFSVGEVIRVLSELSQ